MKLSNERKKIDIIDKKMAKLFVKRLDIVKNIGKYKKENNLEILDKARESEVVNKNLSYVKKYETEYLEFIKTVMDIAKSIE